MRSHKINNSLEKTMKNFMKSFTMLLVLILAGCAPYMKVEARFTGTNSTSNRITAYIDGRKTMMLTQDSISEQRLEVEVPRCGLTDTCNEAILVPVTWQRADLAPGTKNTKTIFCYAGRQVQTHLVYERDTNGVETLSCQSSGNLNSNNGSSRGRREHGPDAWGSSGQAWGAAGDAWR